MREPELREDGLARKARTGALSAACFIYKKLKRLDAPLEPEVEYLHVPSGDYHWNESFYFNFTDPKRAVGGWTRIGILSNQESDQGVLLLYAGGTRILATLQTGKTAVEGELLSLGTLDYHRLEPLSKWRIIFEGQMADLDDSRRLPELNPENLRMQEVEVDLVFEGVAPCFNYRNVHPRAAAEMIMRARTRLKDIRKLNRISSHHYEQAGRVGGEVRIGNREIPIQGSGYRDHSWGPRDWAAPRLWTWLTCQFGEEMSFNLSRVAIASVDILGGFVTREGVNYPLRRASLETEFEEDGITQRSLGLYLEDVGGEIIEATGKVLTVAPLHLESGDRTTLVNEAFTEYRRGDMVGYGISEYLHQIGGER